MDEFRKEVIKELENVFGDGYQVLPYDKLKNNETTLHGICIHNENERISPVLYLEEYVLLYAAGKMTVKEISAEMLDKYCMGDMPHKCELKRITPIKQLYETLHFGCSASGYVVTEISCIPYLQGQ